jgi:hypothetical protein
VKHETTKTYKPHQHKKPFQPRHQETWCEPNEWSTSYVDADGCLTVALDCGQHYSKAKQEDVFNGTYDSTCTLNHKYHPNQGTLRTSTQMSVKTGGQS